MLRIERCSAAALHERAHDFLVQHEAEHNLLLGIVDGLLRGRTEAVPDSYFALVLASGEVAGCAFRTPPLKLGLTRMPPGAPALVAADVAACYDALPAVLGPETECAAFAAAWQELRPVSARPGMRQRIYQLTHVTEPDGVAGRLRQATPDDLELVTAWLQAFGDEAAHPVPDPRAAAEAKLASGAFYLWEDGEPCCLAGRAGRTPHGERIGPVYTPPEQRGRGYGSACTAALSRLLLDEGRRFCFLYTDLGNATSNALYQRIGYVPVCDVMDYDFCEPSSGRAASPR